MQNQVGTSLGDLLQVMKENRKHPELQIECCRALAIRAHTCRNTDPTFFNNKLNADTSLCVLLALKAHPDNAELRNAVCCALCARLLHTSCAETIVRFGDLGALKSILVQDKAAAGLLGLLVSTTGHLCSCDSKYFAENFSKSEFVLPFLKAVLFHPDNGHIQFHGMKALEVMVLYCKRDQEILIEYINTIFPVLSRFASSCGTTLKSPDSAWMSCRDAAVAVDAFIQAGGICPFKVAMQFSGSALAMATILDALVIFSGDDVKLDLAKHGLVQSALGLMLQNAEHMDVQMWCCHALGVWTTYRHPIILESIAKADGVNNILDAIQKFPNEETIFNYGGSAALLVREFELG